MISLALLLLCLFLTISLLLVSSSFVFSSKSNKLFNHNSKPQNSLLMNKQSGICEVSPHLQLKINYLSSCTTFWTWVHLIKHLPSLTVFPSAKNFSPIKIKKSKPVKLFQWHSSESAVVDSPANTMPQIAAQVGNRGSWRADRKINFSETKTPGEGSALSSRGKTDRTCQNFLIIKNQTQALFPLRRGTRQGYFPSPQHWFLRRSSYLVSQPLGPHSKETMNILCAVLFF